ncbi:hypothetical protein HDV03_002883 [Kappamyces sp. JEL0829]|nr:hypothetical protein HDV03_002883 [Kappamyces sp. JEL0829]
MTAPTFSSYEELQTLLEKGMQQVPRQSRPFDQERTKAAILLELLHPLEPWTKESQDGDFAVHKLYLTGLLYPLVRGDSFFANETPQRVLSVIRNPNTRSQWDARFDGMKVTEHFPEGAVLATSVQKGQFPVAPRDLCHLISVKASLDAGDNAIDYLTISVKDERCPPVSGKVRGEIMLASWRLRAVSDGVAVSYVAYVDPQGSIPTSLFKLVQSQVALCVPNVGKYLVRHGPMPCLVVAGSALCTSSDFKPTHADFKADSFSITGHLESGPIYVAIPNALASQCELKTTPGLSAFQIKQMQPRDEANFRDMTVVMFVASLALEVSIEAKKGKALLVNGVPLAPYEATEFTADEDEPETPPAAVIDELDDDDDSFYTTQDQVESKPRASIEITHLSTKQLLELAQKINAELNSPLRKDEAGDLEVKLQQPRMAPEMSLKTGSDQPAQTRSESPSGCWCWK